MRILFVYLVIAISSSWAATALSPTPILLEIDTVGLPNGGEARGVKLAVGNPPRNFAFQVQLPLNNVFVYGSPGFCSVGIVPWTDQGCAIYRGGYYNPDSSSTWKDEDSKLYAQDDLMYPRTERFLDDLRLGNDSSLPSFPLATVAAPWATMLNHPLAAIGLGPKSTLLSRLKRSGDIGSRSFGFFWGRVGRDLTKHVPGSLVLGGYDRAKTVGEEHKFKFKEQTFDNSGTTACQTRMVIQISDIIMTRTNGETESLMPTERKPVEACIVPDASVLLRLPREPYINNFHEFTNSKPLDFSPSFGLNFGSLRYSRTNYPQEVFAGSIIIRLTTGLEIKVPNDQLILSPLDISAKNGQMIAAPNMSEIALGITSNIADVQQPITLGRQFLTSAYLLANQDDSGFSLWEAKPTTVQNLVSLNSVRQGDDEEGGDGGDDYCGDDNGSSCDQKKSISTSAIIGITVGSVVFVTLVGAQIWLWRRKGKRGLSALNPHRKRQTIELPASSIGFTPDPYGVQRLQQPDRAFHPSTPGSIMYQRQQSHPHQQWYSPMSELSGQRSPKLASDGYSY